MVNSLSVLHAQLCPTLCNPMDCSLLYSSAHRIFQSRILEWVAISSFRDLPNTDWTCISCIPCIGRWIFFFFYHWVFWEAQWILYGYVKQNSISEKKYLTLRKRQWKVNTRAHSINPCSYSNIKINDLMGVLTLQEHFSTEALTWAQELLWVCLTSLHWWYKPFKYIINSLYPLPRMGSRQPQLHISAFLPSFVFARLSKASN